MKGEGNLPSKILFSTPASLKRKKTQDICRFDESANTGRYRRVLHQTEYYF